MDTLIIICLSGLSYGFVLFLLATGLSLVLGLMGIVNLAHGAFFMVGAYTGTYVAKQTNSLLLGVIVGGFLATVVGFLIERGFLRFLYRQELMQILATLGFVHIITNIHQWIYGGWPQSGFVPEYLYGAIIFGKLGIPYHLLSVIVIGGLACIILWLLQEKTRIGAIVRAGMDDAEMTGGLGINLTPINIGTFCLGAFLAGFAGVVGAPVLGGFHLNSGHDMFFVAIGVCIVGGVGSIQGALVGALLIGLAVNLVGTYAQPIAIFVMYILMVLVLFFKPEGLITR
jgi:branched-chain amino acid transport system permease protein